MTRIRAAILLVAIAFVGLPAHGGHGSSLSAKEVAFRFGRRLVLRMTAVPFDPSGHVVKRCKVHDWSGVCLIDGRPVFGTDWETPTVALSNAQLEVDGATIPLDVSCMFNPWIDRPSKRWFSVEATEGGWRVRGCFSDAAGGYVAEWRVVDRAAVRTILSDGESLMVLFPCNRSHAAVPSNPASQPTPKEGAAER